MRDKLVVGNWKSNGALAANQVLLERIRQEAAQLAGVTCGVCVPYPYLAQTQRVLAESAVPWGAQDVSQYGAGAYTGAVAASMLLDFGCRYAIVGHSERRTLFGESDTIVAAKFEVALQAKLTPILCVGESLQEREAGVTESVVARQLMAVLERSGADAVAGAVIAYEPVWAIGTGRNATPEQAQAVHAFIRGSIAAHTAQAAGTTILYGGSVKAANAAQLFAMPDIDGGLIGGASLVADEFITICRAAARR
ncbi:MAG TPA: triose-phosphate isomerase [Burkholderiales bacterium]|nr:triose-phosphate isomerase [Burkholderiales bacterium]